MSDISVYNLARTVRKIWVMTGTTMCQVSRLQLSSTRRSPRQAMCNGRTKFSGIQQRRGYNMPMIWSLLATSYMIWKILSTRTNQTIQTTPTALRALRALTTGMTLITCRSLITPTILMSAPWRCLRNMVIASPATANISS
jgi:hypothetical protein